jgi:hypothetical protein
MSQSRLGPSSAAIPDTVVRVKAPGTRVDALIVAKKDKAAAKAAKRALGPATVIRPALKGAAILYAIEVVMHVFLKA